MTFFLSDEGSSGRSDEQTKDGKTGGVADGSGKGGRDGGEAKDGSHRDTGTELVTGRSKDETHEDGSTYTDNGGSPDLLLGESKIVTDLREKRGDGEPDEESAEETPPRAVEGTHVRAGKRAKLDGGSLVILVRVDINVVGVVFLPLSL